MKIKELWCPKKICGDSEQIETEWIFSTFQIILNYAFNALFWVKIIHDFLSIKKKLIDHLILF